MLSLHSVPAPAPACGLFAAARPATAPAMQLRWESAPAAASLFLQFLTARLASTPSLYPATAAGGAEPAAAAAGVGGRRPPAVGGGAHEAQAAADEHLLWGRPHRVAAAGALGCLWSKGALGRSCCCKPHGVWLQQVRWPGSSGSQQHVGWFVSACHLHPAICTRSADGQQGPGISTILLCTA